MLNQLSFAAGYLTMFLVPALLLLGIGFDLPSFAFGMVMFVLPLARPLVGKLTPSTTPLWNEQIATVLQRLPLVYSMVLTAAIAAVLKYVASAPTLDFAHALGLGLSLWMVMLFATCVAHELIHRRGALDSMVGHYVAGVAGYPPWTTRRAARRPRCGGRRCRPGCAVPGRAGPGRPARGRPRWSRRRARRRWRAGGVPRPRPGRRRRPPPVTGGDRRRPWPA